MNFPKQLVLEQNKINTAQTQKLYTKAVTPEGLCAKINAANGKEVQCNGITYKCEVTRKREGTYCTLSSPNDSFTIGFNAIDLDKYKDIINLFDKPPE